MSRMKFNIHSENEEFEYQISENERLILEVENVDGELKVITRNEESTHLNLLNKEYDYLDLYEHDYKSEKHKSSINDILKSKKEQASITDSEDNNKLNSSMNREDIIEQYINKHSS